MSLRYRLCDRVFRCSDGFCGASDCTRCSPGCDSVLETTRDLRDVGYDFDPEDNAWHKCVAVKRYTARKAGARHGFEPGTIYRKITYRSIDDESGESSHHHRFERA